MTKEESIKYLQQLYPNGGHCWLDEQRIEAIGMAVKALQEEPVSNPTPNEKMSVQRWKRACEAACCDRNYRSHYGLTETRDDYFVDGVQWADEHPKEEPKFKTGDRIKPIDSCLGSPRTILEVCDGWYVTDQGTLDFEYEDNWELAEEHKKCMYSKDNCTNEDRKALCDGCEEECEYSKKKEPVSEDFEKALAREWHGYNDRGAATVDALEDNTQELAFAKGFYRGAKWQKKQMMANAVEGVVHHFEKCKVASVHYNDPTGVPMAYFTSPEGLSAGDKVKINVIKED